MTLLAEAVVAALLVLSGLLALTAALGLWRLPDYFLRLHAPALGNTLGSWAVTLASVVHFTVGPARLTLHVWLIIILLSITAPVTAMLLARTGLFRGRYAGDPLPPPLLARGEHAPSGSADAAGDRQHDAGDVAGTGR